MHDLVIRNGTVVDGTGADRRLADIAIDGESIVAVEPPGSELARGAREIDADGMIVTPGWVDIHTHYDGQVTWDPDVAPSSVNGVTSILLGNCGVGFAPVKPDEHQFLIELLEGVEDIPGTALSEGMTWGWESFPEYLDLLDRLRWTVDVGTQVPHAALRTYVMGEPRRRRRSSGLRRRDRADVAPVRGRDPRWRHGLHDLADLRASHVARASRSARSGPAPTRCSASPQALRRAGTGVIQLISDAYQSTDDELVAHEIELLGRIAMDVARPLSFTVQQNDDAPNRFRELLECDRRAGLRPALTSRRRWR